MSDKNTLTVIILAAGKGSRMKSDLPKVLHPLAGMPMIAHVFSQAQKLNPEKIVLVVAPGMDDVRDAVPSAEIAIQHNPQGTGHAVMAAQDHLKNTGDVVILYGDTPFLSADILQKMVATRRTQKAALCVAGFHAETKDHAYGRLIVDGDRVTRIVEHGDATPEQKAINLCNGGVMVVDGSCLKDLLGQIQPNNAQGEYYLPDLVDIATAQNLTAVYMIVEEHDVMGINSRNELAQAEQILQNDLRQKAMENGVTLIDPHSVFLCADTKLGRDVVIHPFVVFGSGVEISDGVVIQSFCHIEETKIGANAAIGPHARLRGGAQIGADVKLGNFVEVKKSTLARGVKASHLSYLGDAEIGENANIGAGTITCNYDGFEKSKTIVGKNAFVGSNSSLVAPVHIGDDAMIGAGSVITENVPAQALGLGRGTQTIKENWTPEFRARKMKKTGS